VNKSKIIGQENSNIFEKLYNDNEEKQKKLLQKAAESLPAFKPNINKKVPNYFRNKPQSTFINYTADYFSEISDRTPVSTTNRHKYNNSTEQPSFTKTSHDNYNTISAMPHSDKTQKSRAMNSSVVETFNNPIIVSNSEGEEEEVDQEEHEDVLTKYKKALELSQKSPPKNTNKTIVESAVTASATLDSNNVSMQSNVKTEPKVTVNKVIAKPKQQAQPQVQYTSDKNKEKLEMYNQKIAALLNTLKKTEKKK